MIKAANVAVHAVSSFLSANPAAIDENLWVLFDEGTKVLPGTKVQMRLQRSFWEDSKWRIDKCVKGYLK